MACPDNIKRDFPEMYKYLRERAGVDYIEATKDRPAQGREEWLRAAKELQDHSVNTIKEVYAKVGVKGFEAEKAVTPAKPEPIQSTVVGDNKEVQPTEQKPSPVSDKIKTKFQNLKNTIDEQQQDITPKEQVTEGNIKQSGDKVGVRDNNEKIKTESKATVATPEEKSFAQKDLERAAAKKTYASLKGIEEPTDARGLALDYLSKGGKVSSESINKEVVTKRDERITPTKRGNAEVSGRDYTDSKAENISTIADNIYHGLREHLQENISSQDIRNQLIDVINKHDKRLDIAKEYIDSYHPDKIQERFIADNEEQMQHFEKMHEEELTASDKALSEYNAEQLAADKDITDSDEYINHLIKVYENETRNSAENNETSKGSESKGIASAISGKATTEGKTKPANDKSAAIENTPDYFQIQTPSTKEVEQMKDIVKDLIEDGTTELKAIQDIAKEELGDKYSEQLITDAYNEATIDVKIADTNEQGQPIKNELTTSFAKRINTFLDNVFGKSKAKGENIYLLKDTKAVRDKVAELGANTFHGLSNEQQEVKTQLDEARNEYQTAKKAFDKKRGEVDKRISGDQEDLFGGRKTEPKPQLFDERLSTSARDKAIQPFKDRLTKAEEAVNKLQKKFDDMGGTTAQLSMFQFAADAVNKKTEAFYSPLEKFIEGSKQGAFTVEQILGQIKSLPQAEIEAIGLKDFLKGKTKVTKQELLDYVRENKVNVEVVEKKDAEGATKEEMALKEEHDKAQHRKVQIQDKYANGGIVYVAGKDYKWGYKNNKGEFTELPEDISNELDELQPKIDKYSLSQEDDADQYFDPQELGKNTKYGQYTLSGSKENYREVLLTLPTTKKMTEGMKFAPRKQAEKYGVFRSSHFDEPNIIAHIRLTDRTTPDGKRILFVEESQSDWNRSIKQQGVKSDIKFTDEVSGDEYTSVADYKGSRLLVTDSGKLFAASFDGRLVGSSFKTSEEAKEALRNKASTVPDMPFKDKWQELATKKAIQIAAQEGYDGIAWINGEQTKDRYDLSKVVDLITAGEQKNGDKYISIDFKGKPGESILYYNELGKITDNDGNTISGSVGKNLADVLGKDMEQKILKSAKGDEFKGNDLKVGGEWANNLYDKQIPKLVEKYAKQFGGKTTEFGIDGGIKQVDTLYDMVENKGGTFNVKYKNDIIAENLSHLEANKFIDKKIKENPSTDSVSKQFGLEITPDMKAKTESLPMFMKDPKGEVLGFTHGGKIYLNGEKLNPNSPVHEAGHIFTEWAKTNDKQLYDAGIAKVNGSRYLEKAQKNKFYQEEAAKLPENERAAYFQHEALAAAIGDKGAQFVTEAKRKSFAEWAKALWEKVGAALGFKDVTADQLQNMSLDEFAKRAAADILKGEPQKSKQEVNPENPTTVLSFKGLQEISDEFGLDDVTSRERKTDVQLLKDAQNTISKWVDEGMYHRNIENLVKSAENREVLTDEQRIIVQQHLANVRDAVKIAREKFGINSKEFDKALLELKRVSNAGMATRSAAGAALRVGDIQSIARYDVPDMMTAKMEALNVNELTESQKIEIEKKSKEIESKLKTAEEKVALYEAEIAKYKAESELGKLHRNSTSKIKTANKNHNDFVAERQSLKEKLKKQVEEYKAAGQKLRIASDGNVESFILTAKMAKTIGEIVKSHVEEIGNKLADVTKRTFADVKDLFGEGITEKDIHDVIAGKYNEAQKTKSQLQIDLKDLQDEAKLIDKLDNLERSATPKTEKEKVKRNQQIKELQDKIKGHDITKLSQIKERNKATTNKIREKIAKEEFDKEEKDNFLENLGMRKRFPKQYKEAMDAVIAKDNAKHDFEVELYKDALNKRSKGTKVFDKIKDVIGTTKALRAGIDFSALMIQNIVPIMSHPIENAPNIIKSFREFASNKKFERSLAELHNSKYWELIQKSGLDVTEPKSAEATNKEEIFNRNLLEKDIIIKGKRYNIGKYTTAPFERAFTSLGNAIRVSSFLKVAEKLEADGYTFDNNPEIFRKAAKLFNTQTGRGILPDFINRSSETVNTAFWSPRLMASRLNLLGLGDIANPLFAKRGGFYRSLGEKGQNVSYLQRRAALDMVKFIGGVVAIYGAAAFFFGADPDLDPRSTTFGDLKDLVEDKTYNLFGGFSQYVKLVAILATGQRNSGGGKVEDVSDAKGKSRSDLILKFLRGKVTPVAGVGIDILDKKDYLGRPINVKQELLNLVSPLSLSGIPDDINRDGLGKIFINGLISMTGVNVKDNRDYQKVDRTKNLPSEIKKDFERTKDEGFLPPNVTSKIVYEGHDIKLDDKQHEEFTKMVEEERSKLVKETIKQDYYKRASDDERKSYLKSDYADGRENAKTEFLNKNKNLTDDVIKQQQAEQKEEEKQRKERSK